MFHHENIYVCFAHVSQETLYTCNKKYDLLWYCVEMLYNLNYLFEL